MVLKYWIRGNYETATRLTGKVPLIYSIQSPDYPQNEEYLGKSDTTEEVFDFLRSVLKTNMATWAPTWGDNVYHWSYVKEFLRDISTRYPNDPAGGLNATCPTLLAPCISGNTTPPQGTPSLSLKTPPSPVINNSQSLLEIEANQSGTLSFTGDCTFTPTAVQAGSTFLSLTNEQKKVYTNCQIILTNSEKKQSTPLIIPIFTLSYKSDINKDKKVDIFDFSFLISNFGKNECNNVADLNDDCKVDIFDFTIFLGEFGRGVEGFTPIAELTSSSTSIISGQSITLTWNSTNTTSCIGTNFNTNNQASGSVTLSPTNTTIYTLTCEGSGGSVNKNITVNVTQPPAPTVVLSASSTSITSGQSITLTWNSTNTTSCIGTNFNTNNQISGSQMRSPTVSTTYTITCENAIGQTDTKSVVVTVGNDQSLYPVVPGKYSTLLKNFADTAIRDGRDTYGTVRSGVFVDGLTVATPHKPVMWEIDDAYHKDTGYPKQSYLCNAVSFTPFSRLLRELTKITNDTVYSNASRSAVKQILSTQLHVNGLAFWGPHSSWDCLNDEYTGHTSLTTGNKPTPLHEMKNTNLDYRYMYSIDPIATTTYIQQFWNASVKDWTNLDYTRHPTFSVSKKAVFGEDAKTTVDKIVKNITLPYITQQSKFSSVQSELLLSAFMYNYLTGSQKAWDAADTLNQYQMRMRNSVTKLGPPRYAYKEGNDGQQNKINTEQLVGFGDIVGRYLAGVNVLLIMAELSSDATKKEYFLKYANEELMAWADYKHISGTSTYKYAVYLDGKRVNNINGNYRGDGFVMFYNYAKAYRMTGNVKYWNMARDIFNGYELGSLANTPNGVPQLDFVTPYKIFTIVNESQKRYDGFIIHGLLELYRATENRKYLEMSAKVADDIVAQLFKNNLPLFVPNARYSRLGEMWPLALADIEVAIQDKRLEVDAIHPRGDMIFHSEHKTLRDTFNGTKRIRDNLLYMQTNP
ncbi:MAG: hypothetical protein EOM19_03370 [Candidatus Moranbacteria bacterium]|nr:hypothetical protein [Candidatus Moranbacteria bacterium]